MTSPDPETGVSPRVFFSFDHVEDLWRASVVRNRWIDDPSRALGGLWSPELSPANPRPLTEAELSRFVESEVEAADVVAVLIGERTAAARHVMLAIRHAVALGRGLVGIYINGCRNKFGTTSIRGPNPFDLVSVDRDGRSVLLSDLVELHDWVADGGFAHLPEWIADAAARAPSGR